MEYVSITYREALMEYVSITYPSGDGWQKDGPLHIYAGQRTDRDAGKVTACGLILPASADVYGATAVFCEIGTLCGDCFGDPA